MSSYGSPSGQTVEIIFRAIDRHGRFSAHLGQMELVTASRQPFCDAARVLYKLGYPDNWIIVARHDGASHESMRCPIGSIRRLTVREDKNGPRFVKWVPFQSRRVEPRISEQVPGTLDPPSQKNERTVDRGANAALRTNRPAISTTAPPDTKPNFTHRSRTPKSGSACLVLRVSKKQSASDG
jgi:hypothetical protein